MTTLELVYFVCDEGGKPCEKGVEFAEANPKIESAINTVLKASLEEKLYLYLWWIVSQKKVIGWGNMTSIWMKHSNKVIDKDKISKECAEVLRKWLKENTNQG